MPNQRANLKRSSPRTTAHNSDRNNAHDTTPAAPTTPLRLQVYEQLRRAIELGTFAPGARLPPSREHAQVLGVSRNTVLWALERLRAEGLVLGRVGDGSYVAPQLTALAPSPGPLARARQVGRARSTGPHALASLSQRGQVWAAQTTSARPSLAMPVAFRVGFPAIDRFPFEVWERLSRQTPASMRLEVSRYIDPAGHGPLREAIAQWLLVSRGIRCEAEQVLVVSGSQQGLDLIGRLLIDPGDAVWVEDPGYPGARGNLAGQGAQLCPVPVDDEGLCVAQAQARWPQARLAVVTPTHQFPLGVHMSLSRRLALLQWARTSNAWVVEDDYDGEFQYGAHRLPALCSLPHGGRVIYVGTFSKTLHAGLRLGFLVLPPELVDAFTSAKGLTDRHCPSAPQDVLARFIREGHLLRHLRRMRELYLGRQGLMIDALARATGGALQLAPAAQGMHLLHEAPRGTRDAQLTAQAHEAGVYLAPLSAYTLASPRRGWLFGYAGYAPEQLRLAAQRLGRVWPT